MPQFSFEAVGADGQLIRGQADGESAAAVIQQLQASGNFPLSVTEGAPGAGRLDWRGLLHRSRLPDRKQVALFTQELAMLLSAGLPIDRVFAVLRESYRGRPMERVVLDINEKMRGGATLSAALARHPALFPRSYTSVVEAGEHGSALPSVFGRLAESLHRSQKLREAIRSALLYPALLLTVSAFAIGFVLLVVLPQFKPLLLEARVELDGPTILLFWVSDIVQAWWWLIGAVALCAGAAIYGLRAHPAVVHRRAALALRLPGIRDFIRAADGARFCRALGTLLESGVPLASAASVVAETLQNAILRERLHFAVASVREGMNLVSAIERADALPPVAIQLARVGQETSRLAAMFTQAGVVLEQAVEQTSARFVALLVPALTIALGIFVGGLIAVVFSALMKINDLAV